MRLSDLLKEANYAVVLTGEGISRECGLKDISPDAEELYESVYAAGQVDNVGALYKKACEEFFSKCLKNIDSCSPGETHKLLAKWENEGRIKSIITENIDCYHQKAGSKNVIELHGSIADVCCSECGRIIKGFNFSQLQNISCNCGGNMRPTITLLNEALPVEALERAHEEIEKADLLLILGSNVDTAPASILTYYLKSTAKLALINVNETALDGRADLVLHGNIWSILMES